MNSSLKILALLAFAAPIVQASAQAAPSPDQMAKYQDEAQKSCNYDLDHNRFGNYASIEECVSDRVVKLAHSSQSKSGSTQH